MEFKGLQEQISSNNRKSVLLLASFPFLVLGLVFAFILIIDYFNAKNMAQRSYGYGFDHFFSMDHVYAQFIHALPWVVIGVGIWFVLAYFANTSIINVAAHSRTIERKDNKRIYNLVENLCMGVGMKMPKVRVIETDALNAFASGINEKTYTVTLTRGIIEKLDDEELKGVIAHELTHIRNNDVRLLIVSVIFVGIFAFLISIAIRTFFWNAVFGGGRRRNDGEGGGGGMILIVVIALAILGYIFSIFFKMALSRKREYMADAGAVEMTKNSEALARALEKIAQNDQIDAVKNDEVKQMFISNVHEKDGGGFKFSQLFATHPPIEKRIQFLRQL